MRLTPTERRWFEAIFDGLAPAHEERLHARPGEVDPSATFETMNRFGGLKVRLGVRVALAFIAASPMWTGRALGFIDSLETEERTRLLLVLSEHPLQLVQELSLLMKVQVSMALLGSPAVRARSGYDHARNEVTPVKLRIPVKEVA